jgi:hypothetical protein
LEQAKNILQIENTSNDTNMQFFNNQSKFILHVDDIFTGKNLVLFIHESKNHILVCKIPEPFCGETFSNIKCTFEKFWQENDLIDLLEFHYTRLMAMNKIKRHLLDNWIPKPICNDGTYGILLRLGWAEIEKLNKSL